MLFALSAVAACPIRADAQTTLFQESFDSAWTTPATLLTGGTAWSGIGSGALEWHRVDNLGGWTSGGGGYSPTGASGSPYSARFHTVDAPSGTAGSLITPVIDLSAAGSKRLCFLFINATGNDRLDVYLSTDNGASWGSPLATFATSIGWTPVAADLGAVTSATAKIRLQVTSDFGTSDVGVDEMQVVIPAPLGGIKTVGPAGTFASLTQAFLALALNGPASGGVTFSLAPGTTFTEDPPALTVGGTATAPVVFRATGTHAQLLATGSSGTTDGAIDLLGADYVTFDGLDIGVAGGSALEYGYFLRNLSSSDGAQNNTIENAVVTLSRANTNTLGVLQSAGSVAGGFTATSAAGANSGNAYLDVTVQNSYAGMYLVAGTGLFPDQGTMIGTVGNGGVIIGAASANDIGNGSAGTIYGIRCERQSGLTITGTTVRNLAATSNNSVIGIWLDNSGTGTYTTPVIAGNQVYSLSSSSTSASQRVYGIRADNASLASTTVYNNDVYGLTPGPVSSPTTTVVVAGLVANAGTNAGTVNFSFNSVRIDQTTSANATSTALYVGGGSVSSLDNILANTTQGQSGVPAHYAAYISTGTMTSASHNVLYAPNTNGIIGRVAGVDRATLPLWAAAISGTAPSDGAEAGSMSADPNFAAPRLLPFGGPTPAAQSGVPVAGISTDIAGVARGTTPTIGSHETTQPQVDVAAPSLSNLVITNGAAPSVSVTAADNNSATSGVVRLWYRLGSSGSFAPLAADTTPGGTFGGVYSWAASLQSLAPGVYQFYLAARDGAGAGQHIWVNPIWTTGFGGFAATDPPDFASEPASYANVRTFSLTTPLAGGTYEVGSDRPVLQKLTDVAAQLAAATLTGNVIYELNASYDGTTGETLPIVFTPVAQQGGPWSVTIRVKAGAGARTTSGASSSAPVILSGVSHLTLDGREGGVGTTSAWSISNTQSAAATAAVWLQSAGSGASDDTLRYLTLAAGADQSQTSFETFGIFSGGTTLSSTTGGAGNDRDAYIANRITRARWGIYARGLSSSLNSAALIQDNVVGPAAFGGDEIGRGGIICEYQSGARIAGNEVRFVGALAADPVAGVDRVGIGIGAHDWVPVAVAANGCVVSANRVHDVVDEESFSAAGIVLAGAGSGSANTVAQNFVWRVRANGTSGDQTIGIGIAAGDGDLVAENSIALSGDIDPVGTVTATQSSAALRIASSAVTNLTLANNALSVDLVSGSNTSVHHYAILVPTSTYAWGTGRCNGNDYAPAAGNAQSVLGGVGSVNPFTDVSTLGAWKAQFSGAQDAASFSADPLFTSSDDLHARSTGSATSPLANAGIALTAQTVDIDGDGRSATTPDVGADEFSTIPLTLTVGAHGAVAKSPDYATYNAGTVVTLTATPDVGYRFDGFSGALSGTTSPQMLTMDVAKSVGATFSQMTYVLTPSSGAGGSVSPATPVTIAAGASQVFGITPSAGFHVADVLVDGVSAGAVTSFTFSAVSASHTIAASFARTTHTLSASAGGGGGVSPNGATVVNDGDSAVVAITPDVHYHITGVLVDGAAVGAVTSYTFAAVTADHTLAASFARDLNDVTVGAASGAITPGTACVDVPVTIARTDLTAARLYTVTVQLSANLTLCGTQADKGGYLSAGAGSFGTQLYVVDNGGHNYTIDETILGSTCQATAASGTLFTLHLASTDSTGSGTIALGEVQLRGCDNAVLPLFAGSGSSITIQNTYTLTTTAGAFGSISPSGATAVAQGSGRTVLITPDAFHHIAGVLVDGASVGAVSSYTFTGMSSAHTLTATFAPDSFAVVATAGAHGGVSPAGTVLAEYLSAASFAFTAEADYHIDSVRVDGASVGAPSSYTFSGIAAAHTLQVTFAPNLNDVIAGVATATITTAAPCVDVPVTIARTNLSAARLYSVTVQLSPNLSLCGTQADAGGYLAAGAGPLGTQLFVTDNGDRTYTIDESILGTVCGATATSGTLFTLHVTSADSSGNGTIAIVGVLLRGCTNQVLPLFAGAGSSVAIDRHYSVTTTAGANGTVTPSGVTAVGAGGGRVFGIAANAFYHIASVLVDGTSVGAVSSYAFTNVQSDHTLSASFAPDSFTVTSSAGTQGSVSPLGAVLVAYATDQTFTFAPNPGYHVGTVLADGVAVTSAPSYTFTAVAANHTLNVSFDSNGTDNVAAGAASATIAQPTLCVTVPVTLTRTDPTPARRYRVTVQLSANLALCGAGITAGSYLSAVGATAFSVTPNGGGSYTVAESLTATCGATGTGTLFTLALASSDSLGSGTVTILATNMNDCGGTLIPSAITGASTVAIDKVAPGPVTALAATQVTSGNDSDGTTKLSLVFAVPSGANSALVYRAPYGNYPLYDNAPNAGAEPVPPASYPPAAPWALTSVTASGGVDETATRDVWYYVAFARDSVGNVGPLSAMTAGTLNYHLGDVSNGVTVGQGDNVVTTADLSLLGAHYGVTGSAELPYAYLDFGPTTTGYVDGRPLTDGKVNFEDFILMAINYNAVAAPRAKRVAPGNEIALTVPSAPGMGGVFTASIYFVGMGDVQGVTIQLGFDPTVLRPVTTLGGPLLGQQTLGSMVLTGVPGTVDIALLGDGPGITNGGVLATMSFQVIGTGNTIITLASTSARDARNRPVSLQQVTAAREIVPVPATTALGAFFPNPARDHLAIEYALHENAAVRLEIFDTAGRLVRALDDGVQVAGEHSVRWDARDTAGRTVANGTYVLRFRAGGYVESRRLLVLR